MTDETRNERAAVVAAMRRVGAETGIAPRVLLAVAMVETAAVPHAVADGRREPLIRFEGHWFDRFLSPADRRLARAAKLAAPKAGAIPNPKSQDLRWRLLGRASEIDAGAAYAATSWGLGQVMGLHWKALGYADPQALAAEARGSIEGQVRLMARFLRIGDLHHRLERGDTAGFARLYNGPGFGKNRYDAKIGAALIEAALWLDSKPAEPRPEAKSATPAKAPAASTPMEPGRNSAKGWSNRGGGLSAIASWLSHL